MPPANAQVTNVLMIVTEIKEPIRVNLASPAPLKHPAKMICDTWKIVIQAMKSDINDPISKICASLKNNENKSLPKQTMTTMMIADKPRPISSTIADTIAWLRRSKT